MDWLCEAKPSHRVGILWIGFTKQSQSNVTDWLCFAKP
jgi:hypothetical protein